MHAQLVEGRAHVATKDQITWPMRPPHVITRLVGASRADVPRDILSIDENVWLIVLNVRSPDHSDVYPLVGREVIGCWVFGNAGAVGLDANQWLRVTLAVGGCAIERDQIDPPLRIAVGVVLVAGFEQIVPVIGAHPELDRAAGEIELLGEVDAKPIRIFNEDRSAAHTGRRANTGPRRAIEGLMDHLAGRILEELRVTLERRVLVRLKPGLICRAVEMARAVGEAERVDQPYEPAIECNVVAEHELVELSRFRQAVAPATMIGSPTGGYGGASLDTIDG